MDRMLEERMDPREAGSRVGRGCRNTIGKVEKKRETNR